MKQQLNKFLRLKLIIAIIIANFFTGVNFAYSAPLQTNTLSKGLIAHFPLNRATMQSATTFKDTTPFARTGTITVGGSAGLVADQKGKAGNAYDFDGSTTRIDVPYSSSLAPTQAISASIWFKADNVAATDQRIISKTHAGGYQLSLNENSACGNNFLCFVVRVGGSYYPATYASSNLTSSTWYLLTGTYDGETVKLYLNGTLINSNTNPSGSITYTNNNPLCISQEASASDCTSDGSIYYFNGSLTDLRIWNRALSVTEITTLYKSYSPVTQTNSLDKGLIADFPLNRATMQSATTFKDTTPYARTGTITAGGSAGLSTDQKGLAGGAYDFDGSTTYIDLGDSNDLSFTNGSGTDKPFSISAWIYADTASAFRAFTKSRSTSVGEYVFGVLSSGRASLLLYSGGAVSSNQIYSAIDTDFTAGVWTHVVGTYNGSESQTGINVYINGVRPAQTQALAGTYSGMSNTTATARIGRFQYGASPNDTFADGRISDLRVYNRVLSATEVKNLYKSYGPVVQTNSLDKGLMAWYPLSRSTMQSATTFADQSPYARTGTITAGSSAGLSANQKNLAGSAYDFHDTTTYITLPASNVLIPNPNAATISFWAQVDGDANADDYFAGFQRSSGSSFMSIRGTTSQTYISWIYANNTNGVVIGNGTKNIDDSAWHHYIYMRNGANLYGYIDGVLDFSASNAGQSASSHVANIGSFNNTPASFSFDGRISDVRVWNRTLTATEIKNLYRGTK
ncbi:MAG: LamG domain-containing protein [Patescibacteria group bacterium]|jgi:hypothetical protein